MRESELNRLKTQKEMERRARMYQTVFGSDMGKQVLADLELFCGQYASSVNEQHPNELNTFFNEGKRRVYLRILSMLGRKVSDE